jgi:signal transduction histidine kinase
MSIKLRLALLLGLLLLGFLGAMAWLHHLEEAEKNELLTNDRDTRGRLLGHWLDSVGRVLPQFTLETAQSEEFAKMLAEPGNDAFQRKVREGLASFGARSLWILRADGTPRLHIGMTADTPGAFPLQPGEAVALLAETPSPRFFADTRGGLLETSVRRLTGAAEWVAVARTWDDNQLKALSALTDAQVTLRGPEELVQPAVTDARVVLQRPLADWQGHAVRVLRLEHNAPEIESAIATDWYEAQVFFAFGLMVIVSVTLALNTWVLRPLGKIAQSLAREDPAPAREVSTEAHEFGRVAQLVLTSFAQRDSLQREIEARARAQASLERSEGELRRNLEERARLGRDLHDGVIQSLYAAGMGLAGIRALLRPEQAEAAARLEQTRAALNETIHDVRNFIIGLEPEALRLQTFSQAVAALCEAMKSLGTFRTTLEIDEGIAGRLSLAQRVHALQIAREAVSNAVRHGEASHVQIRLRMAGEFAEFEVRDNGRGFDPSAPAPRGKGLQNFADRARELGGELSLESKPGHGATIRLTFSLHPHA